MRLRSYEIDMLEDTLAILEQGFYVKDGKSMIYAYLRERSER
jgi:hypothetical protein